MKMNPVARLALGAALAAGPALAPAFASDGIAFRHALDNAPLVFDLRPDQEITEAVARFHADGENPYSGDADAVSDGSKLYKRLCQACHLPDGSGRIGPNLIDDQWIRARTGTDIGKFEIIYAGGAGAMQAFGRRIDQDDILKVMAFIETLRPE